LVARRSRKSLAPRAMSGSRNSSERPRISAWGVAENALAGGIEGFDVAGIVDRDDGVFDVVQNGLQVRGGLLANLARERLGLIGHELHGAHDAAPFAVDPIVVGADRFEQRLDIQLAVPASCLRDLALEQVGSGWGQAQAPRYELRPRYRVTILRSPAHESTARDGALCARC